MKSNSNLEKVLANGGFAVTAEVNAPQSADADLIRKKVRSLAGCVDAFNVTDGPSGVVRMASWAAALIGREEGLDPIVQMTCRDRNRIALQMDLLGLAAMGINNVLCLTGDHQSLGNHPEAQGVWDIDSIHLVKMAKDMRDESKFLCGDQMAVPPRLFIGAAENPFAEPIEYLPIRLGQKVAAGADFVQTQMVFHVDKFADWMRRLRDKGLHQKVKILAGVGPLKSTEAAVKLQNASGTNMPDDIVERLRGVPQERVPQEGISICVEIINRIKEVEGVAGIHIMATDWEESVPKICEQAGLRSRARLP